MPNPNALINEKMKGMQFKPEGQQAMARKVISTKLPEDIDALVRSLPNYSRFVREAVIEKLEREGLTGSQN
ncbi:MAG: hypothetical protein ACRCU2_00740 [Planktothrix sp.]